MSDHEHASPLTTYFAVWIALLVGTGLTYWAATLDLGRFNAAVALIIATTKVLSLRHAVLSSAGSLLTRAFQRAC